MSEGGEPCRVPGNIGKSLEIEKSITKNFGFGCGERRTLGEIAKVEIVRHEGKDFEGGKNWGLQTR
jgi:hypothetical protein